MAIDNHTWKQATTAEGGASGPTSRLSARHGEAVVDRVLFFGQVINTLARGCAFRTWFSRFLKIAAAVAAFAGLVALFNAWQFTARQEASGIIGGILYMIFLSAGIYMVVHATILRAGQIASLPDGEFTVIPVCIVVSLLIGEAYAALSASVSLGGGVLIWFTQKDAYRLLQDFPAFVPDGRGADFLGGVLFMIRGMVRAAVVLTGGYLVSELLRVIVRLTEKGPMATAHQD